MMSQKKIDALFIPKPEDYPGDLPQSIKEEMIDLDQRKAKLTDWIETTRNAETLIQPIREECLENPDGHWLSQVPEVRIGVQSGSLHGVLIFFHIKSDIRSILPVLREARKTYGWQVESVEDYEEIRRRSYIMKTPEGVPVIVCVMLPFGENAKCQYVEVGKKEVPILELRCEDASGNLVKVADEPEGDETAAVR